MVKLVGWNTNFRKKPWRWLCDMDADVALVQEACTPPADLLDLVGTGPREHWDATAWNSDWWTGRFRKLSDRQTMVVKLSDRVQIEWFKQVSPISIVNEDEIAVSGIGTIAAARVIPLEGDPEPFIAVSMYARWIAPHPSTRSKWRVGYADGTAHRIISDLSAFIGDANPATHRILAAGDLNLIHGLESDNLQDLEERSASVFARIRALGLELVGPQFPAGRRAVPTPRNLRPDTRNVVTYRTVKESPATASQQLDYVFASRGFHERVRARALNEVNEWGPSDHCRLVIEVD